MQLSLPGILTIIFVLLKVFGYIDWSWWWVFAPLWIAFALFLLICFLTLGVAGIIAYFAK